MSHTSSMAEDIGFYTKNGYAYTEDRVCITNLFIWAQKPLILPHELEEYCVQNYGPVKKCRIGKCGYVIFEDPRNAASMLKSHEHQYGDKRFYVRPSYSWFQPAINGIQTSLIDGDTKSVDENATGTSIVDLNDDCLLAIFGYLNLGDQIQMTLACNRFENVFNLKNQNRFKTFDFNDLKLETLWHVKELLRIIGDGVERIVNTSNVQEHYQELLKNVTLYCVNLKYIEFGYKPLNTKIIKQFITNCRQIQEIHLEDKQGSDKLIEKFKLFPNLKVLHISDNRNFTGKHLDKLPHLKELRLQNCMKTKVYFLIRAIKKWKNLRSLGIEKCFDDGKDVDQIIQAAPDLEVLHLSTEIKGNIDFTKLRHLKEVSFCATWNIEGNRAVFKSLTRSQSENLQILRIFNSARFCVEIARDIGEFKNLRKLVLVEDGQDMETLCEILSKLSNLEELILDNVNNLNKENLIILLNGCCKLQTWRLRCKTGISQDLIESVIVVVLKEQFESGKRSQKLKILEHFDESDSEDPSFKNTKKKYDSKELMVISKKDYFYFTDSSDDSVDGFDSDDVVFLDDYDNFDDYDDGFYFDEDM